MMGTSVKDGPIKISGVIDNYKATRGAASFVFTDSDKTKFGVIAMAAGLAGLGGQAVAMAGYASSVEEHADYLEFEISGQKVSGWVWRSPFREGDHVDVVGERNGDVLELAAVARPTDRAIALYPHCSRGRTSHCANATKWWLVGTSLFIGATFVLGYLVFGRPDDYWEKSAVPFGQISIGVAIFTATMTASLASKWMPFARAAEKVFKALDLPNPSRIDLVKSSKAQRRPDDPGEYGTFYFRY